MKALLIIGLMLLMSCEVKHDYITPEEFHEIEESGRSSLKITDVTTKDNHVTYTLIKSGYCSDSLRLTEADYEFASSLIQVTQGKLEYLIIFTNCN